jgi:hypothetical protein
MVTTPSQDPRFPIDPLAMLGNWMLGTRGPGRVARGRRTRPEGVQDLDVLVAMIVAIDADGIFLDTMDRGGDEFRARLDRAKRGVVLEGEGALRLSNIHDHHMSWAQNFNDSAAPGVIRNKWFERRHMLHQIDRFNRDHSAELHTAWMNGAGMMVWENVFGTWVGWSLRDRSLYRAMLPIQRRYVKLFCGERWTPLVQDTGVKGVYASLWEGDGVRLWTWQPDECGSRTPTSRSPARPRRAVLQSHLRAGNPS